MVKAQEETACEIVGRGGCWILSGAVKKVSFSLDSELPSSELNLFYDEIHPQEKMILKEKGKIGRTTIDREECIYLYN